MGLFFKGTTPFYIYKVCSFNKQMVSKIKSAHKI
jgi:hypothetical protein